MQVTFAGSFTDLRQRPQPILPEFACLGRSNCGKSSLINYLLQRKSLAHTSRHPGKTQLLNYFLVAGGYYLVDLPGYGYAKVSRLQRQRWWQLFSEYVADPQRNLAVLHLLDSRHAPSEHDREVSGWLVESGRPFAVVATKIDKVGATQRLAHYRRIIADLGLAADVPFLPTSSAMKIGRQEVMNWVRETLVIADEGV
ncbi:MAG: ribosome biogenesis GTP-binding protein YihA/YsxC [Candidatus Krumholzibacteria bacterium]|nr:ribosome biogenesis GTP-binding protein YihA/YsxC [Candidatus Krumholzibacteria bacterium]